MITSIKDAKKHKLRAYLDTADIRAPEDPSSSSLRPFLLLGGVKTQMVPTPNEELSKIKE